VYQRIDHEVIDYRLTDLPGGSHRVRGPLPDALGDGAYFTGLGAAQTFGRFCARPYPTLLAEAIGLPALNLGFPGAGPRFFVNQPRLLDHANRGRFVVVQLMSARSEDNSLVDSGGLELVTRRSDGRQVGAAEVYKELLATESAERIRAVVAETRANWVASYRRLLEALDVPKIVFWFSRRRPDYEEQLTQLEALYGEFPQFVNRAMVETVRPLADGYAECVSSRGTPQQLRSRFTGAPVSIDFGGIARDLDTYYPTPEMHEDGAACCRDTCVELGLATRRRARPARRGRRGAIRSRAR
jgi:hypothetical protein